MVSNLVGGFMGSSKRNLQDDSVHRETEKPRCGTHNARRSGLRAAVVMMSLFLAGQAQATTYYVDKATGSDSRAGTSVSTAWATIGKANATLRAGDTVYVRAGTYDEIIEPTYSGAAGAPITYRNYPGETVTIRGVSGYMSVVALGVAMRGNWNPKSYIVVDGLTIRYNYFGSVAGRPVLVFINGVNSIYNVIRNCTIITRGVTGWASNDNEDAIEILGAQHTTIENKYISGYPRIGVYVAGIGKYTTIRGNHIESAFEQRQPWLQSRSDAVYPR
jgi:hypothetical protein